MLSAEISWIDPTELCQHRRDNSVTECGSYLQFAAIGLFHELVVDNCDWELVYLVLFSL